MCCLLAINMLRKLTRSEKTPVWRTQVIQLNQMERTCFLVIDEIYASKRVECFFRQIHGLTPEGLHLFILSLNH